MGEHLSLLASRLLLAVPPEQDASALMTSVTISPKVGSVIHHRCFLNRKISEPGNIPESLEERDELANGRLQR